MATLYIVTQCMTNLPFRAMYFLLSCIAEVAVLTLDGMLLSKLSPETDPSLIILPPLEPGPILAYKFGAVLDLSQPGALRFKSKSRNSCIKELSGYEPSDDTVEAGVGKALMF